MKKSMILILSLIASCNILMADFGASTTYFGKYYLKNGETFTAYIEYSGYEDAAWLDENGKNDYCSDEGMYQLLKEINVLVNYYVWADGGIQEEDQMKCLVVYKNIFSLQPQGIKNEHGL